MRAIRLKSVFSGDAFFMYGALSMFAGCVWALISLLIPAYFLQIGIIVGVLYVAAMANAIILFWRVGPVLASRQNKRAIQSWVDAGDSDEERDRRQKLASETLETSSPAVQKDFMRDNAIAAAGAGLAFGSPSINTDGTPMMDGGSIDVLAHSYGHSGDPFSSGGGFDHGHDFSSGGGFDHNNF